MILKQPLFGISFEQTARYLYDDIERWNTPERTYITQHTRVSDPSRCVVPLNLQTGSIVTNRVDYGPWFRRLPSSPPVIGINRPIRKNRLRTFFFWFGYLWFSSLSTHRPLPLWSGRASESFILSTVCSIWVPFIKRLSFWLYWTHQQPRGFCVACAGCCVRARDLRD